MKRNLIILAVLLCILLLALTSCIGRDKARSQQEELTEHFTVTFYDGDMILEQRRVALGERLTETPAGDVTWRDAGGNDIDPLTVTVTEDMDFYVSHSRQAAAAVQGGHVRFLSAEDGLFYPDRAVTRAEAAGIFRALLSEEELPGDLSGTDFSDVPEGEYRDAVLTVSALGVMDGYPDGTFRPDESVTRAEFVSALYRLRGGDDTQAVAAFSDVPADYWAGGAIACAAGAGWLSGYEDGLFYPEAALTRAEAAALVERALGREPDRAAIDIACEMTPYMDVLPTHWAYYDIIDASYTNELLAYITGEAEGAEPGFVFLDGRMCHINADTLCLDYYEAGFHTIDGGLYYVSGDGYFIQRFQPGLLELDGSMFYVAEEDGPFLTDGSYGYLYFGEDGRYTSGSAVVDEYVDEILSDILYNTSLSQSDKLYRAYCAIRDGGYYYMSRGTGWVRGSTSWALGCAEVMYETKGGACYYWAAAFLYLARRLGYQAYPVCGGVGTKNQLHAWVVIEWDDGEEYIFDVELEWAYRNGFYPNVTYSTTDMYKQPLNATHVIYVFPGQAATYYGVEEDNDEEDVLDIPPDQQVPPEETEPPDNPDDPDGTEQPDDPAPTDPDPIQTTEPDPVEPDPVDPVDPVDPAPVDPVPVDPVEPDPGLAPVEPDAAQAA